MPVEASAEHRLVAALAALIAESVGLWGVDATVECGEDCADLLVEGTGRLLVIRRRAGDDLFTWEMQDRSSPMQGVRPFTSVLGVLRAVRRALRGEAEPATRLRAGFTEAAP